MTNWTINKCKWCIEQINIFSIYSGRVSKRLNITPIIFLYIITQFHMWLWRIGIVHPKGSQNVVKSEALPRILPHFVILCPTLHIHILKQHVSLISLRYIVLYRILFHRRHFDQNNNSKTVSH